MTVRVMRKWYVTSRVGGDVLEVKQLGWFAQVVLEPLSMKNLVSSYTKQGLKQGQSKHWVPYLTTHSGVDSMGAFHSTQNSGNFGWYDKWNGPFLEYSGPGLKVVLFDRPGYLGRSDRNVPFHLTKLLSPVPLFCILQPNARWLGSGLWARRISEIFAEWKASSIFHI